MTDHYFGKWLANPPAGEEVVVTGASGRFPESNNVYEFRDHLFNKDEMVNADDRRWLVDHPEIPQRNAKIFDINKFDPGYFGIHHRQADNMDPMMRIFLETAIEAIVDAGVNPSELEGSRTGVFVGACNSEMEMYNLCRTKKTQMMGITGYLRSLICNRVSYLLKLKGPSYIVDTACSSSLNALEHALKAIRSGQCDSALVGACNLLLHPAMTLQFNRLGVLSKEGRCKVFDQDADGYVRSEAIICVFIQKAKDAKRIYGQIVYGKVNSDGFKSFGITYPSSEMQNKLMSDIFYDSGISPSDLSFLEAHGTGTVVGDPQEVEAIDCAIAKKRDKPLLIGSVKSNIGHSEPVSGICSLIKAIIAMETGRIPPNVNLDKIKAGLEGFEQGRLKAVTETTDLEGEEAIIGINNFGFGGNNCHLLFRRFKKKKINEGLPDDDILRLVCVSGRSEESVLALLNELNKTQIDSEYIALLHNLFKKNIPNHLHRGYTVISKNGPLKTSVNFNGGQRFPLFVHFGEFCGNFKILGKPLLDFPVFQETMSRINKHLLPKNVNVVDIISQNESEIENNILGAVAVQVGIVDILKLLDLNPTAVHGDSLGKLVRAYYYGRLTLEETVLTAYKVSKSPETISSTNFEKTFSTLNSPTTKRRNRYFNKQRDNNLQNIETFIEDFSNVSDIPEHSIILNISDTSFNGKEFVFVKNNVVTFLDTLGSLYEQGYNLQLHKLYPKIQFPVSRGTPMISPLIKWNYRKTWYAFKFKSFFSSDSIHKEFKFSPADEENKFLQGHVIDDRILFPATGYLTLVWETYAENGDLLFSADSVVFENCKFIRAVTVSKTQNMYLYVIIQKGTGTFVIIEKGSLVATGRIFSPKNVDSYTSDLALSVLDEEDPTLVLQQDEIYRELTIRGYSYRGLFKGLMKCNTEATTGLVKWENNWITFMDTMLQMKLVQTDTRYLYIPIGIKKIVIEPKKLLAVIVDREECLIPVDSPKGISLIRCPGIEFSGLLPKAIYRKKFRLEPVLENNEFVPNETKLDLITSVRVNIQIILENSLEIKFDVVEILDDSTRSEAKLISPLVKKVLEDVPLVSSDLTVSTKVAIEEMPDIKAQDVILKPDCNLLLIVGSKILIRSNLTSYLDALRPDGFILTREEVDFIPENVKNIENIEILTQHVTADEKLILFRKSKEFSNSTVIEVSSDHFDWIPKLKSSLKEDANILVYAQNQELSGILGFVNCIRREPGGSKVRCFFMMDAAPDFDPKNSFYQDQIKQNLVINVYKNNKWGTYRHLLLEELEEVESEHCVVGTTSVGDLSSLRLIKGPLTSETSLRKGSKLIYVYNFSLNFKDIMLASGRINADLFTSNRIGQQFPLGFEVSGRDSSGRRVIAVTNNAPLASLVVAEEDLILNVPESWSLEDASTIPLVYFTVIYALLWDNLLKPGTSILIHSATGGVGIAALNVCLYHGCDIFVTVGTEEKRNYLKEHFPQIPDSHIGNSRDTSFEEMIKIQTNGRGVDIVLNSLIDDKLKASIRCMARGGRFIEIGKFDLSIDTSLNLLLMEREISYHGVMMDQVFQNAIPIIIRLFKKIDDGIKLGYVKPLPRTVFKIDEVEAAFRYMTTGKHIGKIVVKTREEEQQKVITPSKMLYSGIPRFHCHPEKSYIIVGGLGGVGMELADWLMLRGVKKLILVSSSGIRSGYQTQRISIWKSYGVNVHISKKDVTTKKGCYDLIKESNELGPIDAIFNLAAVLKDALFEDQTEENYRISLAPKASVTLHLDEVTRELCPNLRYFVVFSSLSCGRGNPGQTNYGMANSIMERICERRKRDGFPALAIQWGAIGEVGLVAKMQKENKELVIGGTLQQRISSCFEVLDKFLNQKLTIVASMVVAEKLNRNSKGSIAETVAYILGIKDLKLVNHETPLVELGMDSITGTEIIQLLEKDYEINMTPTEMRSVTFRKLIELEAKKKGKAEIKNEVSNLELKFLPETNNLPIIKLSSRASDSHEVATVFILPGIEGVLTPLESLVGNLNAHVFGLHYSYDSPEDSIEEMAKAILPHMEEKISKDQTFHLICYSFGVVVGLEVAYLLEGKGYKGNIVAIDGAPAFIRASINLDDVNVDSEAEFQTNLLFKILSVFLPKEILLENKEKMLKCESYDERADLVKTFVPPNITSKTLDKQGALVLYKRYKSVLNYSLVHEKLKSPARLFKAKIPLAVNMEDDYELSEFFEQPVKVETIEGDHLTLLNETGLVESVNKLLCSN